MYVATISHIEDSAARRVRPRLRSLAFKTSTINHIAQKMASAPVVGWTMRRNSRIGLLYYQKNRWARLGSNQGPVEYKSTALPTELHARYPHFTPNPFFLLYLIFRASRTCKERLMRTFISNADRTDSPEYDYQLDPLHPRNRRAAKLLGWSFDPDFR